jgi:mRNA (2'-O-methyladenosine-N6-)-methyltransferase
MDEAATRAALGGGDGGEAWDDDEDVETSGRKKRQSSRKSTSARKSYKEVPEEDEDDEDFEGEDTKSKPQKKRVAKKVKSSPPNKKENKPPVQASATDVEMSGIATSEKQPPSTSTSETSNTVTSTAAAVQTSRVPFTQEEALEREICRLEQELMAPRAEEEDEEDEEESLWKPPKWCVPIRADVRDFQFDKLAEVQKAMTGRLFDVILTDPPWQLACSNPTRGVALGYDQLNDQFIKKMPFPRLQENGFLFMWVINAKYRFALSLFEEWGYELVDEITWVKQTVNRRLAKSHGFYLQHAKETCLVGRKGNDPPGTNRAISGDVIFSERRGQSQKPTEIYEYIEKLVPGGYYLEIFGRRNNTRDGFVTIGNEL